MPPPWSAASPTSSPSSQPGPDEHERPFGVSEGRSKEKERQKGAVRVDVLQVTRVDSGEHHAHAHAHVQYRMYKRRWVGVCAIIVLNIVAGMSLVWFGPIANNVVEAFGFTLDEVNWLGNVVNFTYLPCAALVPAVYARLGVRRTCYIGAVLLLLSAWIRYAGTASSLSVHGKYALLIIGQIIAGVTQPVFQVLIPGYSERWFDLKGRTTATMLMSIANPIGNAIGQLISPLVETPAQSILVLAIIYSAATPFVFIVLDGPPTPPTHAGEQRSPSFMSFVRAMVGREPKERVTYMTRRERSDLVILALAFGVLVGVINAFSILTAQDFEPYGYSDDISGLFGATILLTGIVAAFITAPLFDRVFTHHLALTCKLLCPFLGGAWLGLIWAVRRNDTGALFALMAVIGVTSLTMLPVALELAVELTRNADASSAVLWASACRCAASCCLCFSYRGSSCGAMRM
ncbi:MFS general substrate transporter, partial [Laetiporus sulphureus 93-53]